jgi:hypothetical protein
MFREGYKCMPDYPDLSRHPRGLLSYIEEMEPPSAYLAARGYVAAEVIGGTFSSVMSSTDGYVPDPHDDPVSQRHLFLTLPPYGMQIGDDAMIEQLRTIHQLSGELGSKMSELELGWYLIFMSLMSQVPRNIIDALINIPTNGTGQRRVICDVADAIFPDKSDFRQFIRKLRGLTDVLQVRRNAVAHSVIRIVSHLAGPRIVVTGTTKPSKLPKPDPKEIEKEIIACLKEADRQIAFIKHYLQYVSTGSLSMPSPVCPQPNTGWKNPLSEDPAKKPQRKKRQPES